MAAPVSMFSFIGGAAALAAGCGRTIHYLYEIQCNHRQVSPIILSIAQELATIQCAWTFVQTMLEQRQSEDNMNPELLLQLNQTIRIGRQILAFLNDELSSCTALPMNPQEYGFRQRTRTIWNERRLKNHQDRIRGQIMSMSLLISLLRL